jgi:hypothetical protein
VLVEQIKGSASVAWVVIPAAIRPTLAARAT